MNNNGNWWLRSPSYQAFLGHATVSYVNNSGALTQNDVTQTCYGSSPALKINLNFANDESASGYSIYNTGTMNLYGGNVYDNVYSSANINTKMACNIARTITLGDSATITLQD